MRRTLLTAAIAVLVVSGTAAAATQPPRFYWPTAKVTAFFNYTIRTQQLNKVIPANAPYTASCVGLTRSDGVDGTPDYLPTKTGRRYRFFLCTARSACWAGGVWRVHYVVIGAQAKTLAEDFTRLSASSAVAQPNPNGC